MFRLFGSGAAALSVAERVALAVATALIGSLLLAVSARVQVPLWPVPMTLQTLVVLVIGMTLGARFGAVVVAAYVLEGVLGLPVFAGTPERGVGLAYLAGPTGGYLIGFIVAAFVAGWMAEHGFAAGIARAVVAQAVGTAVILAFGAAWLAVLVGFDKAIAAGVVPFLVPSAVKIVLGGLLVGGIGSRFARVHAEAVPGEDGAMEASQSGQGPLAGVRVIELSSTVAGPFCGRLLADFGAEVIKIEPAEGDALRLMGERKDGISLYAASILRNKKLIALDMRRSEAQALVRDLVRQADIFVENFRPGTMEKWGLGYDALSAENPGLVMVRVSGYGQTGPYSQRPGYGVTSEAISGLRDLIGEPERPPSRTNTSLTDYITGLYAAFGAMMALFERASSGKGQVIDAALYEAAFSFVEPHVPAFAALGKVATRAGGRLPGHVPNNLYPTADGRYIQIVAASDSMFGRLLKLMQREEVVADPRFATPSARAKHPDEVDALVEAWTASLPLAELERLLAEADVPSARVYTVADVFSDPHFAARSMLATVPSASLGEAVVPGVVPKLSRTPGAVNWAGRGIGDDTADVLSGLLGLSPDDIEKLREAGIVGLPQQ